MSKEFGNGPGSDESKQREIPRSGSMHEHGQSSGIDIPFASSENAASEPLSSEVFQGISFQIRAITRTGRDLVADDSVPHSLDVEDGMHPEKVVGKEKAFTVKTKDITEIVHITSIKKASRDRLPDEGSNVGGVNLFITDTKPGINSEKAVSGVDTHLSDKGQVHYRVYLANKGDDPSINAKIEEEISRWGIPSKLYRIDERPEEIEKGVLDDNQGLSFLHALRELHTDTTSQDRSE